MLITENVSIIVIKVRCVETLYLFSLWGNKLIIYATICSIYIALKVCITIIYSVIFHIFVFSTFQYTDVGILSHFLNYLYRP